MRKKSRKKTLEKYKHMQTYTENKYDEHYIIVQMNRKNTKH